MTDRIYAVSWYDLSPETRVMIIQLSFDRYKDVNRLEDITLWMKDQGAERVDTSGRNNKLMFIFESQERYVEFCLKWF